MPELQMGQQEQELRQLLNKDKSKRSKGGSLPRRVHGPLCGRGKEDASHSRGRSLPARQWG